MGILGGWHPVSVVQPHVLSALVSCFSGMCELSGSLCLGVFNGILLFSMPSQLT